MEKAVKILYVFATLLLTCVFIMGWQQHSLAAYFEFDSPVGFHMATVIPATLIHFFASLGVIFYFVGTGLWMKEEAQKKVRSNRTLSKELYAIYEQANKLKGLAFPFATFSIFFGILGFVLGGALHVGSIPHWLHPFVASLLLATAWGGIPCIFIAINKNYRKLNEFSSLMEVA